MQQRPEVTEAHRAIASLTPQDTVNELSALSNRVDRPQYREVAQILSAKLIEINAVMNLAKSILIQHEGSTLGPDNGEGGGE